MTVAELIRFLKALGPEVQSYTVMHEDETGCAVMLESDKIEVLKAGSSQGITNGDEVWIP